MTQQELINFIWTIANLLRGPYRPPQYRRVMIPLTVLRRLDCVLEPSKDDVLREYAALSARNLDAITIERTLLHKFRLPFFNVSRLTFQKLLGDPNNLAFNLISYIKGFSSDARRIIEGFEFDKEVEKLDQANRLFEVVKQFAACDLHPDKVPNTAMGYVFEDLVRRFNEQANEEAGDHFTPREVIRLMIHCLFSPDDALFTEAGKVITLYDPCCGTGGMLTVAEDYVREHAPGLTLKAFGQEYNAESYAICGSDLMIKGEDPGNIVFGDTLGDGKSGDGHPGKTFHYQAANPPYGVEWKPEQEVVEKEHRELGFNGRFGPGLPRINDGSFLFLLHMMSKMRPAAEGGTRLGIVFNGSPLFTGDAGSGESEIRRWIIENDTLEAIIGLPDQMFYNTGILTYIWIVTNRKEPHRRGQVQLIDATGYCQKMRKSLGNKRNEMSADHIGQITRLYAEGRESEHVRLFNNADFGYIKLTVERPLRLNFQASPERIERLKEQSAFKALAESKKRKDKAEIAAEEAAGRTHQQVILAALASLDPNTLYKDRAAFTPLLDAALKRAYLKPGAPVKKAILAALSERDETAAICREKDAPEGAPEPDADLRDTENVPLPADCPLPLPLNYGDKADIGPVLDLVREHCETYFAREVTPHVPDAWIAWEKTKVGFEIPFNRHFYQYQPPRPLDEIGADIQALEQDIVRMLAEVTR
jgi:type I restriction enzyme M protein